MVPGRAGFSKVPDLLIVNSVWREAFNVSSDCTVLMVFANCNQPGVPECSGALCALSGMRNHITKTPYEAQGLWIWCSPSSLLLKQHEFPRDFVNVNFGFQLNGTFLFCVSCYFVYYELC